MSDSVMDGWITIELPQLPLRTRSNSRTLTSFFSLEIKALFLKRNARHDFPSASIALCLTCFAFQVPGCSLSHHPQRLIHIIHIFTYYFTCASKSNQGTPDKQTFDCCIYDDVSFFLSPRLVLLHSLLIPNTQRPAIADDGGPALIASRAVWLSGHCRPVEF